MRPDGLDTHALSAEVPKESPAARDAERAPRLMDSVWFGSSSGGLSPISVT